MPTLTGTGIAFGSSTAEAESLEGWPPPIMSGRFSLRFYVTATATANFMDRAYIFSHAAAVSAIEPLPDVTSSDVPAPFELPSVTHVVPRAPQGVGTPYLWCSTIRICNDGGGTLQYSFDGVTVHGEVKATEQFVYRNRHEAGIAVRGASAIFRIEAW